MREELQSILLEDLDMSWPGLRLLRLALNRHMPRVEKLSGHRHGHSQYLLYLRGSGTQRIGRVHCPVRPGSVLHIPAGWRHGFMKSRHQRPVCLAVDFVMEPGGLGEPGQEPADLSRSARLAGELRSSDLLQIERWLFELGQRLKDSPGILTIAAASLILRILAALDEALASGEETRTGGRLALAVNAKIRELGLDRITPGQVAKSLGQSLDHLNRLLHREGMPTVGKLLLAQRLAHCQSLLAGSDRSIGDIAAGCGFYDQNYFARWFRKHTGQTPSGWRKSNAPTGQAQ